MYKRDKLTNGLRVVSCSLSQKQSVSLGVWINTGGRYEDPQIKGVSHFLEHLLFKGSRKYSCRLIKESIEGIGGSLNGFTSEELTCYLVKIPGRYLVTALDILADMVLYPQLKPADITKERTVILEELKMYRDLPQNYVYDLLDELLWPNQALGTSIIGTVESVNNINRDILKKYQASHYTASNIVISAAGFLDHDLLIKQTAKIFSTSVKSSLNTFAPAIQDQVAPQLKILHKDTEQTHMALGFHALKRDDKLRHAQTLLHIILGANMSSRLFNEVREKRGLAYEIGTGVRRFADTGAFLVHAGIDNCKVEACLGLIFKELNKIKKIMASQDEFKRAKEFCCGQLGLALEDTMEYMLWMGESVACLDKVHRLRQVIREINAVSMEEVQKVAKMIFDPKKINLALIGPSVINRENIYSKLNLG